MFVLEEAVRSGDPRPGDWGVMIALGPGVRMRSLPRRTQRSPNVEQTVSTIAADKIGSTDRC